MEIIQGRLQKPVKCLVYGPEGIGKSTFASLAPNPLFCDVEDGSIYMDVRRLPRPTSYQMVLDEIHYVKANPSLCDTFVVDTADWLERLCRENVCANAGKTGIEDFGYGKGYSYIYEDFGRILNALDELLLRGIHIIVTAHAVMRKFEQPDELGAYDRWELKLNNSPKCSTANLLKEWADMVLFANYETIVVKNKETNKNKAQGGQRVMYTTHHPCWDAKNRFGLPDKLPFDFRQVAGFFPPKSAPLIPSAQPKAEMPPPPTNKDAPPEQLELPILTEDDPGFPFTPDIPDETPRALADLMRAYHVSAKELTRAVARQGYYPESVPLAAYPKDFMQFLSSVWDKVMDIINNIREEMKGA